MIGYKAFNNDLTCRDFQYEIGKTYEIEESPICCERGFHFCKTIANTYNFYYTSDNTRICKIEAIGEIVSNDDIKFCTNKIIILEEITEEWQRKANVNNTSSGYCNSGNSNSGNCNSGNSNSGNWNSGSCNSGNWNSGNWNSGNRNSGNRNSGNWNSGNRNSGCCNSGNWNSGNWNSGIFNTTTPTIRLFNKETNLSYGDKIIKETLRIMGGCPYTYSDFIDAENMSDEEKENHPEYKTIGGYVKVFIITNKDKQKWWDEAVAKKDKDLIKSLPNFDADVFYECTGIRIKEN